MLIIDELRWGFNKEPLFSPLSLELGSQHRLGISGSSGAGKSSLLNVIAGLHLPLSGQIYFNKKPFYDGKTNCLPWQREIGYVLQDNALWQGLSVIEHLWRTYIANQKRKKILCNKNEAKAFALDLLEKFHLTHLQDTYPHMLSGGQARRVAIARALAVKPKLLLLDEPFNGLDQATRKQVLSVITTIHKSAMIIVSHHAEDLDITHQQLDLNSL